MIKDIDPKYFIERGYGVATVYYGDIEPDFKGGEAFGVRSMFHEADVKTDAWGAISAWSWGLGKVMDLLETIPQVDAKKVAVSGISRLGKTAIWAGASDARYAMVIPIVSGEGGASISRRNFGETVADLTNPFRYFYWYTPRYTDYAFKVNELPVDGHMLLTLIAPRPVLQVVGLTDTWSDSAGEWVSANAAKPVYELYGLKGVGDNNKPPLEKAILNDMGFYMHDEGHTVLPRDFKVMADFMDLHFKD